MIPISLKTIFARLFDAMDRRDQNNAWVVSGFAPTAFGVGSLRIDVAAGVGAYSTGFATLGGGNKTPGAAHASQSRVDLIYFDNAGVLQIAAGATSLTNPIPPALPAGAIGICLAFIGPGATDYTGVAAAYILDIRQFNALPWVPDGTAAAPGMAFGNQPSTGVFRPGSGIIALSAAATEVARFDANTGVISANMALALGAIPATTGVIRLANNVAMYARNAGNTADDEILRVLTNDVVQIATAAGLQVYSGGWASVGTTPALSGTIRIPNNQAVMARNAGNTQDIGLIHVDGSNNLNIGAGGTAAPGSILPNAIVITLASTTTTAGIRLPHGSAPTSPTNGDLWTTTTGVFARINGATVGPFGAGAHIEAKTVTSSAGGTGTITWTSAFGSTPSVVASPVTAQTDAGLNVTSRSTTGAVTQGDGANDVHMAIAMENN